jgi:hypothetical protein
MRPTPTDMETADQTAAGGRPIRIVFMPVAAILVALGIGLTAWPSGQVGIAFAGLVLLWVGVMIAARHSGPIVRYGGSFFLASALWAALGFGFPSSFSQWPTEGVAESTGGALPVATLTDDRYKRLSPLTATVRSTGGQFAVTNEGAQPWQDVTLAIIGADTVEYDFHLPELDPGQIANAPAARFVSAQGSRFNPQRSMPRTFIITADIGAGGPAGVYAAHLQP